MVKNLVIVLLALIIVVLGVAVMFPEKLNAPDESPTVTSDPSASVQCKPEQRNAQACIALYAPVCATVEIQCVKAPCNPIPQTFGNSCEACANPLVRSYNNGECK